ncbi:hypothetical protein D9756_008612 [Leucocoprinus leucothites]|uniref:GPI-anchored wall transfer protein n=1 Tax=Leucocoprinus leucothites TaxID=201217 RepID=A0A8H5CZZ9_9AGAR|nr:hypothetical protein D9756_008612 [Leucoagaricus leucothites]
MDAERYKQEKVNFVSDTTGSSVYHINAVSLVALVSIALYASLTTRFPSRTKSYTVQWFLLVLPLLLSMTLFATAPITLCILIGIPTIALLSFFPRRDITSPLPSNKRSPNSHAPISSPTKQNSRRFPFMISLSVYRAHMMLMTVLAIPAVDFPVFPRILAKCESFGVSLMDLGVGSFVFSQGLVSAIPFISQPYYLLEPTSTKLYKTIRKSIPVFILGFVRVLLVKGTDYPEHVTEYGVHWNFFLTLSLLPILQILLHPLLKTYPISIIGLSLSLLQQIILSASLQPLILSPLRTHTTSPLLTLLLQNKEGLASLLGYLSIHILGLSLGTIVLPFSPSFFRRHQSAVEVFERTGNKPVYFDDEDKLEKGYRQTSKTALEVVSYSIVWWVLFGAVRVLEVYVVGGEGGVSRRMVNLSYILWVTAFNTSFFLGYFTLLDILFHPQPDPTPTNTNLKKPTRPVPPSPPAVDNTPPLLNAINRHGLLIFLLANLLTGAVNLSMRTMYVRDMWAMSVLSAYSFVVCGVGWWLDVRKRKRGL